MYAMCRRWVGDAAFDTVIRSMMPAAYRLKCAWEKLTGRRVAGAAVAAWRDGRLLCVRHSYRPGWALPGGEVGRTEAPVDAAAREFSEEVGIRVESARLRYIDIQWRGDCPYHQFEYELPDEMEIRIDNREIVVAAYLLPGEISDPDPKLRLYLRVRAWMKANPDRSFVRRAA